jgi:undecaprenyl-diphosphatase
MLEKELLLERGLFFFLNGSESHLLDNFFYLYSYKWTWVVFYLCFLVVFIFIRRKNWKEILCVVLAVSLLILFCDQLSSHFFKPVFHRLRPTYHPDFANIVDIFRHGDYEYRAGGGKSYGFISGHATNSMGFAVFTALIFRNKFYTTSILLFALTMGYSRIYLGVHFISDVVVGFMVGAIVGYLVYKIYMYGRQHWAKIHPDNSVLIYARKDACLLSAVFWVHLVVLFLFNNQWINMVFKQ